MKKSMSIIAFFAVLLLSVSASTGRVVQAAEGFTAPQFEISNSDSSVHISLADLKGSYVLLNFWDSADAMSRMATADYEAFARSRSEEERFCLLSVNLDRSERLFREIVRRDNLSAKSQIHLTQDEASRLIEDYRLDKGNCAFLINPEGRIIAVNPTSDTLDKLI